MIAHAYTVLKSRILELEGIDYVDWYTGQDLQNGDQHIKKTPAVFIEFLPTQWIQLGSDVQQSEQQVRIHLVSQTRYGDEYDMLDTDNINHEGLQTALYKHLQGYGYEYTDDGTTYPLISSMVRTNLTHHHTINNLISTYQQFDMVIHDYSGCPEMEEIIATLELEVMLTLDPL